jgi:hypothetical protein
VFDKIDHLFLQLEEGVEDAEVELLHERVDVELHLIIGGCKNFTL